MMTVASDARIASPRLRSKAVPSVKRHDDKLETHLGQFGDVLDDAVASKGFQFGVVIAVEMLRGSACGGSSRADQEGDGSLGQTEVIADGESHGSRADNQDGGFAHMIAPFLFTCSCYANQEKQAAPLPHRGLRHERGFRLPRAMLLSH